METSQKYEIHSFSRIAKLHARKISSENSLLNSEKRAAFSKVVAHLGANFYS